MLKIPAISIANMIVMSLAPVRPQHIPHSMYRTHSDGVLRTKQPELSLATQMFVISYHLWYWVYQAGAWFADGTLLHPH